jgi:2-oxoglutarate dehydrogenase E1 component
MIDQFISAGEDKWLRQSGLTLLLPHGYMGQGAEHSSCRIERFLQQVDEDPDVVPPMQENERMHIQQHNWQVVNCTTPANYYHVLRRQSMIMSYLCILFIGCCLPVHRDFRKPLIIVTPKNLLRDKNATSALVDMAENTKFKRVFGEMDSSIQAEKVVRVLMCSGKVYYELVDERTKRGLTNVAILRIEQIAPFPWDRVAQELAKYPNADVVWAQVLSLFQSEMSH